MQKPTKSLEANFHAPTATEAEAKAVAWADKNVPQGWQRKHTLLAGGDELKNADWRHSAKQAVESYTVVLTIYPPSDDTPVDVAAVRKAMEKLRR